MIHSKKISRRELDFIIKRHEEWLKSEGKSGERAMIRKGDLSYANLNHVNLTKAEITCSSFYKAELRDAIFYKANLHDSRFDRAELPRVDFSRAGLRKALFWKANLSGANLWDVNLDQTDFTKANLSGVNLERARFQETNLEKANLSGCRVYGVSVWDTKGKPEKQLGLIITPKSQPNITIDNIKLAQTMHLLLHSKESMGHVIDTVSEKIVLILGRFADGGLEILKKVATKLRENDFVPCIIDFKSKKKNFRETVMILAGLAHFIVVDLSGPSVPAELEITVKNFEKTPFVPILETGRNPYSLFHELQQGKANVLNEIIQFSNKAELEEIVPSKIITPALEKLKELRGYQI